MILVDTSVWIDHLHATDPILIRLLEADRVATHPLVIQELALGSMRDRSTVLEALASLRPMPVLSHDEMLHLVDSRRLWGRGLSAVDVHLVGSVRLVSGARLWTRDKRLAGVAHALGVDFSDPASESGTAPHAFDPADR